jgi:hypothetical protein
MSRFLVLGLILKNRTFHSATVIYRIQHVLCEGPGGSNVRMPFADRKIRSPSSKLRAEGNRCNNFIDHQEKMIVTSNRGSENSVPIRSAGRLYSIFEDFTGNLTSLHHVQ